MAGGSTRAVVAALVANVVIAVARFIAAGVTGSTAMLSEGIHSLADSGNQALLLWGNRRSQRPPDAHHPFGYAPEMYFWSLIVAMILFGLGGGFSIYEGIAYLEHTELPQEAIWNYTVLGVAFMVEGYALPVALRALKRSGVQCSFLARLRASADPRVFRSNRRGHGAPPGCGRRLSRSLSRPGPRPPHPGWTLLHRDLGHPRVRRGLPGMEDTGPPGG